VYFPGRLPGFEEMVLHTYKFVRGVVLGLMFFLAVTAACSTDSYDPDPYDDIPPVVTVEFNYVVPSGISIRQFNVQAKTRQSASLQVQAQQNPAMLPAFFENPIAPAFGQDSPQLVIPLRR
jgi:hypothetical protein